MSQGVHLGPTWLERLRRSIAFGCVTLVLALAVFAASPLAHGCLHDNDPGVAASDHGCAVTLFAAGVALSVGQVAVTPPAGVERSVAAHRHADVLLVSPRYLRQPERGPPVG